MKGANNRLSVNHFFFVVRLGFIRRLTIPLYLVIITPTFGQQPEGEKMFELYGYLKTDIGYNFDQINPDWFDVLRVTRRHVLIDYAN